MNVPVIHKRVAVKDINWSLAGNDHDLSTHPVYKVSNNHDMNRLANAFLVFNAEDYWPVKAVPRMNYINNNEATYSHDRTINVKHTGYNQFSFDSPKKINRLALPLLHYKGEHLRVYVNHHLVHSYTNGNSLVTLDNVKKGRSVVGVRSVPNGWIVVMKSVLFFGGVIWLIILWLSKVKLIKNWLENRHHLNAIKSVSWLLLSCLILATIWVCLSHASINTLIASISSDLISSCLIMIATINNNDRSNKQRLVSLNCSKVEDYLYEIYGIISDIEILSKKSYCKFDVLTRNNIRTSPNLYIPLVRDNIRNVVYKLQHLKMCCFNYRNKLRNYIVIIKKYVPKMYNKESVLSKKLDKLRSDAKEITNLITVIPDTEQLTSMIMNIDPDDRKFVTVNINSKSLDAFRKNNSSSKKLGFIVSGLNDIPQSKHPGQINIIRNDIVNSLHDVIIISKKNEIIIRNIINMLGKFKY